MGNDVSEGPTDRVYRSLDVFPIPMRGNENFPAIVTYAKRLRVSDPHEG